MSNEWKRRLWVLCLLLSISLVQAPVRWVELVGYLLLGLAIGVVGLKLWQPVESEGE